MVTFLRSLVEVVLDAAAVSLHSCPYAIQLTVHGFVFRGQCMDRQQSPLEDETDLEVQTD